MTDEQLKQLTDAIRTAAWIVAITLYSNAFMLGCAIATHH